MTPVLAQLLEDPTLPEKVAILCERLQHEQEARKRFYDEMRPDQKVEFINGQVIMHSPAMQRHLLVTSKLVTLVTTFVESKKLGLVLSEKALCVFPRNDYEPDLVFFLPEKAQKLLPDTLKFPIPDFVCEVLSDSTAATDRGVKFQDFAAHGVGEYWIVDAREEVLEQYILANGSYDLRLKSGTGEVRSLVIAGFAIPIRALFDGEINLNTLRAILK